MLLEKEMILRQTVERQYALSWIVHAVVRIAKSMSLKLGSTSNSGSVVFRFCFLLLAPTCDTMRIPVSGTTIFLVSAV